MTMFYWRKGAGLGGGGRTSVSRRQGKFRSSLDKRDIWRVVRGTRHEKIRRLSWHLCKRTPTSPWSFNLAAREGTQQLDDIVVSVWGQ